MAVLEEQSKIHEKCWKCRDRRLVCDRQQPQCGRCVKEGLQCPGYATKRPIRFMPTGLATQPRRPYKKRERKQDAADTCPLAESRSSSITPPAPRPIRTTESDVSDALSYYRNVQDHRFDGSIFHENEHAFRLPELPFDSLPPFIRHSLIANALSHRMYTTSSASDLDSEASRQMQLRILKHKGAAMRELNASITDKRQRMTIETQAGVVFLAVTEMTTAAKPEWDVHCQGMTTLLNRENGAVLDMVMKHRPKGARKYITWVICLTLANSTFKPHNIKTSFAPFDYKEIMDFCLEDYDTDKRTCVNFPCPSPLLVQLLLINELRYHSKQKKNPPPDLDGSVAIILHAIASFDPFIWASARQDADHEDHWILWAAIYKHAMSIFAYSTLLPLSPSIAKEKRRKEPEHRSKLLALLRNIPPTPLSEYTLLWPTIVAGFAGAKGTISDREFIRERLKSTCKDYGVSGPMNALKTLEMFWDTEETEWDACFDGTCTYIA